VGVTATLLDATLCLLLVSAGAVTVATTVPGESSTVAGPSAAATAETLATSTTTVEYSLAPGIERARPTPVEFHGTTGPGFRRTSRGSYAELLADAAVGRASVGGDRLTHARDGLVAAVRRATAAAAGGAHTQVVAVWRPYPDAPVRGRVTVGDAPPPTADVRAGTLVATGPVAPARSVARDRAATAGYAGLAGLVANRTVRALFPPARTRVALDAGYPTGALVAHRYHRAGDRLGVAVGPAVEAGRVDRANRRLAAALRPRIERDLRRRFDRPAAAAESVAVGRVRIVVRRWSA
jgi:hypothetical protein